MNHNCDESKVIINDDCVDSPSDRLIHSLCNTQHTTQTIFNNWSNANDNNNWPVLRVHLFLQLMETFLSERFNCFILVKIDNICTLNAKEICCVWRNWMRSTCHTYKKKHFAIQAKWTFAARRERERDIEKVRNQHKKKILSSFSSLYLFFFSLFVDVIVVVQYVPP